MKFFRIFIAVLAIAAVADAVLIFFKIKLQTEHINEVKSEAVANHSVWKDQNNCSEEPLFCANYLGQFEKWLSEFNQYKTNIEKTEKFQAYNFLKELDETYAHNLNSGGLASLSLACVILLVFVFLIVYLLGMKKSKNSYSNTENENSSRKTGSAFKSKKMGSAIGSKKMESVFVSKKTESARANSKTDTQSLLRKATECATSEPMQAISYLEQSIESSLSSKLSTLALLLCGSLRLKNKIGEEQGKEQLKKVISTSPKSKEAEKATTVLNTFK